MQLSTRGPPEPEHCQYGRGTAAIHEDTACRQFPESTIPKARCQLLRCKPHNLNSEPSIWLEAEMSGAHLHCLCWLRQAELQCRQAVAHGLVQARGLHIVHAIIDLLSLEEQSLHNTTPAMKAEHRKQEVSTGMASSPESHCWDVEVVQPQTRKDAAAYQYHWRQPCMLQFVPLNRVSGGPVSAAGTT